jgi:hypothetical protein
MTTESKTVTARQLRTPTPIACKRSSGLANSTIVIITSAGFNEAFNRMNVPAERMELPKDADTYANRCGIYPCDLPIR